MITRGEALSMLRDTASKWNAHNAPRLGASLAYYTLLSLAPLSILLVAICRLVFTRSAAESNLLGQLQGIVGHSAANTLRTVLDSTHHRGTGVVAGTVAVVILFFGASGVFVELRDSLNLIWDAHSTAWRGWRVLAAQRLTSFVAVLALGFLLLVSLILSAALGLLGRFFSDLVPAGAAVGGETLNLVISPLAVAALFALIFKFVPDVPIAWRDVVVGAVVTSILFSVGRVALSFYLRTAGIGSAYGAAGSVVAFVVWVYYSAQIFFFGAILTRVYADKHGSRALSRYNENSPPSSIR
jgi:membrane protein